MDINQIKALAAKAAETEDQTVATSGGDFEYTPPPAGKCASRFIEYIEIGSRKQKPYKGKDKPNCPEVRLKFELCGKKHLNEVEDGSNFQNFISVKVAKKLNEKASFFKLMKKMMYGRPDIGHMAAMLTQGFITEVIHNEVADKNDATKVRTFANIRNDDGEWLVGSPNIEDPITNEITSIAVPESVAAPRIFLWDHPTQESWDALFIDGTRTVTDSAGVSKEVSKNWLQEEIMAAENFEGSPLQAMLGGIAGLSITEPEDQDGVGEPIIDDTPANDLADAADISGDYEGIVEDNVKTPVETKPEADTSSSSALEALGL